MYIILDFHECNRIRDIIIKLLDRNNVGVLLLGILVFGRYNILPTRLFRRMERENIIGNIMMCTHDAISENVFQMKLGVPLHLLCV